MKPDSHSPPHPIIGTVQHEINVYRERQIGRRTLGCSDPSERKIVTAR